MLVIIKHDKYLNNIFVKYLKSNTVLKALFALIPVNKDLEFTFKRERAIV